MRGGDLVVTAVVSIALVMIVLAVCALVGANDVVRDMADKVDRRDQRIRSLEDIARGKDVTIRQQAAVIMVYRAAERASGRGVPWEPPTVRPFFGSERHLRAVDALAEAEASRADWDEPTTWGEPG